MGEILGLGITHYPGLAFKGNLARRISMLLEDPALPEQLRSPEGWPARMREQWGDDEGEKLVRRYLERRTVVGPVYPDTLAFVDADGARLEAEKLSTYVSGLRRVGVNAEFNSALCRGLLSVRFDLETPFVPKSRGVLNTPDSQHVP